jgi:hypothetical protein
VTDPYQYPQSGGPGQASGPPQQGGYPQGYPQQGGYQQGYPQQGGQAAIALTTKYFPLAFMLGLFKPKVSIDGYEFTGSWGRSVIPVTPGQHNVQVHIPYFLPPRLGPADAPVMVHPGQTLELEYRAPLIAFISGSLGTPPQKYNGATAMIIIGVITFILMLCACGGPLLASLLES